MSRSQSLGPVDMSGHAARGKKGADGRKVADQLAQDGKIIPKEAGRPSVVVRSLKWVRGQVRTGGKRQGETRLALLAADGQSQGMWQLAELQRPGNRSAGPQRGHRLPILR